MTASDLIALLGLVAAILIGWNQIQPKVNTLYKYFEKKLLNPSSPDQALKPLKPQSIIL